MIDTQTLVMFLLVSLAMGGIAWVFVYPHLSGQRQAELRRASIAKSAPVARSAVRPGPRARREQIEETLREIENRQKKTKSPTLSMRIARAGLAWSKQRFMAAAGGFGLVMFLLMLLMGTGLIVAFAIGFASTFGAPLWLLMFLQRRRENSFLNAFPEAIDVIVRGIKSGLPVGDCLKVIAAEAPEPVRSEFRAIVETQTIGIPLGEACAKLYERMRVPEANFFGIVISIQQKAGGNLSEALSNLSRVLRDRKKMQAKIRAMSMEARASAAIIAALPIAVLILVYLTSPDYISLLWTTEPGRLMLAGSAVWMTIGVLVMKKMINFDF